MAVAIYYHPDAYTSQNRNVMGRNAAGESFLKGYIQNTSSDVFWAYILNIDHGKEFAQTVKLYRNQSQIRAISSDSLKSLSDVGCLYYPGPNIDVQAYRRAAFSDADWSICGITHTTSSATAMDAIAALITAPVQEWDALICTSSAVKDNVTRVLQAQVDYLQSRLGVTKTILPQLPVIPLGIHTSEFNCDDDQKAAARKNLGIASEAVVVLYIGRLSFHAKAHPLVMYQALEIAAKTTGKKVVLVECGWHANEHIAKAYADAARFACPSVQLITLDGRKVEDRQIAWAGADVFCSLSDNIQETFGITPIEAMAAGLPVVVSDWDGYKDTVRHGIDGFRIPTMMPEPGFATDLALRHALEIDTYDLYCGLTCSLISVDLHAAAAAFERLFSSAELRRKMGAAGRKRAIEVFDWKCIIPQYERLWAQLGELRKIHGKNVKSLDHPWPARMDPFHAFASYPSVTLNSETKLALVDVDADTAIARALSYRKLAMVRFAEKILPSENEIQLVLKSQNPHAQSKAINWVKNISDHRKILVFRTLSWFVKMGILRVV